MNKTSVETFTNGTATRIELPPTPAEKPAPAKRQPKHPVRRFFEFLASLQLTVILFALSVFLVFVGTMAQAEIGIWTATNTYFRSPFVWVPFQLFMKFGQIFFSLPTFWRIPGSFPFVGGTTLGVALLVNLLTAHALRFKIGWKRAGIFLIHSGLIVMMLGEFAAYFQIEGRMSIRQGGSSHFLQDYHKIELVFLERVDEKNDRITSVPGSMLRRKELIQNPDLPVDIQPVQYMVNSSRPKEIGPNEQNIANAGDGKNWKVVEVAEASGAASEEVDVPSAYVTLKEKGTGKELGTYLVSVSFSELSDHPMQTIEIDGKKYDMTLRFKRTYKQYQVELLEFHHDVYPGTDIPKNFSSKVVLTEPRFGERREAVISMNAPLQYRGETFYQASVLGKDEGTILQVVKNHGWWMPYLSCIMVTFGMIVHFGIHLNGFFRRILSQSKTRIQGHVSLALGPRGRTIRRFRMIGKETVRCLKPFCPGRSC